MITTVDFWTDPPIEKERIEVSLAEYRINPSHFVEMSETKDIFVMDGDVQVLTITRPPAQLLNSVEVSKITVVKLKEKEFIYFDKLKDGTWRLCFTEKPK